MKITISCSMQYRNLIKEVMAQLTELGFYPLFPNLDYNSENEIDKKKLAIEHYQAIDEAEIVYFITPDGYIGTSCKLELGYAIAKNKLIYFSEQTNDPVLDCYAVGFISTDSLRDFLFN